MRPVLILMIMGALLFTGCAYQQPYQIPVSPEIGSLEWTNPFLWKWVC